MKAVGHQTFGGIKSRKSWVIQWFSTECRKTETKLITYQLDYSANLKP